MRIANERSPDMNDANESKRAIRHRISRWPMVITVAIIASGFSFVAGYQVGVSRQETRLLNEFVVNATRLGIIDYDRLQELTEDSGTNTEIETASANGQGGDK